MFSMSVAIDLTKAATKLGLITLAEALSREQEPQESLPLCWPELERVLPDRGFPKGVVELACVGALGGATRGALAAVRGGQGRSSGAWCAWLDPEGSLYAPGVAKSEVDLQRMLVVRPPRKDLAQVAVKLVGSRAFEVVVVDCSAPMYVPHVTAHRTPTPVSRSATRRSTIRPEVLVRKLALLADQGGSTVVLITDASEPRPMPWPVALRLELARSPGALTVKVAKDRACRLATSKVAWPLAG